jgi:peptide/nickel transport system ATP-binding protein
MERNVNAEILHVKDLRVYYHTYADPVKAVDGVTFSLHQNEKLGLVGESGSGKSTAALAILRLTKPPAHVESGVIGLDGVNLLTLTDKQMNQIRFAKISLIPQGAMNSLNPVLHVKDQIYDVIKAHEKKVSKAELEERAAGLMEVVGLKKEVIHKFPHELSGGMKQRVCIAMSIALHPQVIIADEPTSALDVVTQRQVMETLDRVQSELNASVILVGHDMGLMAQFVDTIGVMYAGRLVEVGPVLEVFKDPLHPYTQLLISSLPSLETKGVFRGIPGVAPSLRGLPSGCHFHPRCPHVMDSCALQTPSLVEVRPRRWVSCHLYRGTDERAS